MDDIFTADYSEGLLELLEWRWARRGSRTAGRTRPSPRLYLEIEKKISLSYGSAFVFVAFHCNQIVAIGHGNGNDNGNQLELNACMLGQR